MRHSRSCSPPVQFFLRVSGRAVAGLFVKAFARTPVSRCSSGSEAAHHPVRRCDNSPPCSTPETALFGGPFLLARGSVRRTPGSFGGLPALVREGRAQPVFPSPGSPFDHPGRPAGRRDLLGPSQRFRQSVEIPLPLTVKGDAVAGHLFRGLSSVARSRNGRAGRTLALSPMRVPLRLR